MKSTHDGQWMLVIAAAAALAGCDAYSPDLGDAPFRCGAGASRCPHGYTATGGTTECFCRQLGPIDCDLDTSLTGDPLGNDTHGTATITGVGPDSASWQSSQLSICPAGDIDVFILTALPPRAIEVSAELASGAPTHLALFDTQREMVAAGAPEADNKQKLVFEPELPGALFLEVSGDGEDGRYSLVITLGN